MFVDSHCHLNRLKLAKYAGHVQGAIDAAEQAGVDTILAIMCNFAEYHEINTIIEQNHNANVNIGMSVGVHPCEEIVAMQQASVERLVDLANQPQVWAIGETGLDYYYSQENKHQQQHSFIHHIVASQQLVKPLVVHSRHARQDTLAILADNHANHGIIHCFTENWAMAKAALDLGFYISFSGIVSFKNATELQEIAKKVPLDRMLIETDSPYLAPVPNRGKPNEPSFVPCVAAAIASLRNLPIADIATVTRHNFINLLAPTTDLSSLKATQIN